MISKLKARIAMVSRYHLALIHCWQLALACCLIGGAS